jgi:hypothetical protein
LSRGRLARALAWLERLANRRSGAVVLFALALAVYAFRAVAYPLTSGRDLDEYLYDYIQFLDWHPLLPWSMLFRTPVPGLLAGGSLDLAGGFFAEPLLGILFAGSVVAWAAAARIYSARAALLVAAALLVYPAWGLMFHELSSEPFFAAAFSLWGWLVVRAAAAPSVRGFVWVGLGVALLALIRPGNAVLLVFLVFPLLVVRGGWKSRLRWAGVFVAAAVVPLAAWAVLNGVRFGDYALARGGNAVIPFYRAFISDRIVSPDNGPASRRLADAIQHHLLTRDPYKAYRVTLHQVFTSGSFRIHEDLYVLSDEVFGWDSNYSILRKAGIEAVRAHPGKYTSGVLSTIWHELSKSYFRTPPAAKTAAPARATTTTTKVSLPRPSEGEPIPPGQNVWIDRPDNSIRDVWTSGTHHHFAFSDTSQKPRFHAIERERDSLFSNLPDRSPNGWLLLRFNELSRWFPRLILWIAVGLLALAVRRPRGWRTLAALALSALFVIVLNALGLFADPRFALPVAPAFVLFGACALLGSRDADVP